MTISEIAEEHGVSRQSVHAYRTRGIFPKAVEGEGSTRARFREDEVTAFFVANPKSPGKRTDRPTAREGAPVTTKRIVIHVAMSSVSGSGSELVLTGDDIPAGWDQMTDEQKEAEMHPRVLDFMANEVDAGWGEYDE